MKVVSKQQNSRMCIICGMDNPAGVQAPFYNMVDGSVMTRFKFAERHQSYPGRVHGGMVTTMLDELGLRAIWAKHLCEDDFGVTMSLTSSFRKPVPYDEVLFGRGEVIRESSRFVVIEAVIYAADGSLLANGELKYLKLPASEIVAMNELHGNVYLVPDDVTELNWEVLRQK